jgi:hypothetical protein
MARNGIRIGDAAMMRSRIWAGVKITVSVSPTFALPKASASETSFFGRNERLLAKEKSVRIEVSI